MKWISLLLLGLMIGAAIFAQPYLVLLFLVLALITGIQGGVL